MLGIVDSDVLVQMTEAVLEGSAKKALRLADEMNARSFSFSQAVRDWASLFHSVAIAQRVPDAYPADNPQNSGILRLAKEMTPEEVQLDYQIVLQARADMSVAPDEYAGFTMAVLRMLAFKPAGFKGTVPAQMGRRN